ncbi:MAG: tetratricopeptide repeat protein [Steroidobacteraceae bacterium]
MSAHTRDVKPQEIVESDAFAAEAESHFSKGQMEEAEVAIRKAIRAALNSPVLELQRNWQHYCILGRIWSVQKRLEEALGAFRHAVQLAPPNTAPPHWLLGLCLLKKGQLAEAETELRAAIRLNPKASAFHTSLGAVFIQQCFYDDAHASLHQAIRLDRKNIEPHILLAELLVLQGDPRGAEKSLAKAHALAPQSPRVLWALAKLFEEQGKTDKAVEYTRKILALDPTNTGVHIRISTQYKKAGRLGEAEEALRAALLVQPTAAIFQNLSLILEARSRSADALAAMSEACRLDPGNRAYRARLADLSAGKTAGAGVPGPSEKGPEPAARPESPPREARLIDKLRAFRLKKKIH